MVLHVRTASDMGKLTPDMSEKIRTEYSKTPSYKIVAKKLHLDWKTVKNHVTNPATSQAVYSAKVESKPVLGTSNALDSTGQGNGLQNSTNPREDQQGQHQKDVGITASAAPVPTPVPSKAVRAYRLFSEGKEAIDVAIELDASGPETEKWYSEYLRLKG